MMLDGDRAPARVHSINPPDAERSSHTRRITLRARAPHDQHMTCFRDACDQTPVGCTSRAPKKQRDTHDSAPSPVPFPPIPRIQDHPGSTAPLPVYAWRRADAPMSGTSPASRDEAQWRRWRRRLRLRRRLRRRCERCERCENGAFIVAVASSCRRRACARASLPCSPSSPRAPAAAGPPRSRHPRRASSSSGRTRGRA